MNFEQALDVANAAVFDHCGRHLSDVETAILQGAWQSQTYEKIADASGYSVSYVTRDVGPKLWKLLSKALGESVSKTSFRAALERRWRQEVQASEHGDDRPISMESKHPSPQGSPTPIPTRTDWGNAVDVSRFYGREAELATLQSWIQADGCRLLVLLGMGGIGKTSLSVKLAQQIQGEFECVIWRSLRNAPPLDVLLGDLVSFLSKHQEAEPQLRQLVHWLQKSRCLVILDNVETLLEAGCTSQYRWGYEDYGDLFRTLGETPHQSCFILTSREKPSEIAALEGLELSVRSLRLKGLQEAARELFAAKGLEGSESDQQQLIETYGGNPLALKIVSTSIQELFDGNIGEFIEQSTVVFNGIKRLLDQQFNRLSSLEKTIMYWLAIEREWTKISELASDLIPTVSRSDLLGAIESLSWRSLIEKQAGSYTQQPVVMEYVTELFTEQVCQEIVSGDLNFLNGHTLLKAQGKDYIKEAQTRQLSQPIINGLLNVLHGKKNLLDRFDRLRNQLQQETPLEPGYAGGNLLNLLGQLQPDLRGWDFSRLTLWQADLRRVNLQGCNFAGADLTKSVLTETLGIPLVVNFSPDGQHLATGDANCEIVLWDPRDGTKRLTCKGHTSWIWSVAFSPDGETLASGSEDHTVKLWDARRGDCLQTLRGHTSPIWSVVFSPDGKTLASSSEDHTVKLWEVSSCQCLQTLEGHTSWVRSIAWSPDGGMLVSGSDDHTLKLWEVSSGQCLQTLEGHTHGVWSVAWSPDGQRLASGSGDRHVKLWDADRGKCLQTLQGHRNWVRSIAFAADGYTLASGSEDQTVKLWDTRKGDCRRTLQGHSNWVRSVAFSPDGGTLASASGDHTVKLWETDSGHCCKTLQGHTNRVWSIAFSPDGETLASTYDDRTVKLWDPEGGQLRQTLYGHTNWVCSIAFSPDGETLASGSSDQTVKLWNAKTGEEERTLRGHSSRVWSLAFSPNGRTLASGSYDQTVKLWDLDGGECSRTLVGQTNWVWTVAFSPDGRTLASGSDDQTVKLWDLAADLCCRTLEGHSSWVWTVAFSPHGQTLASGSDDQTVKLWDLKTKECIHTLVGHTRRIWAVAFSPDGQRLASGSGDRTVKLWDSGSGECLQTLEGHEKLVCTLAFSPDGQTLATGSQDETIVLWEVKTGKPLKTLRAARPYEGTNITGVTGLTEAQKATLKALGAVER